MKSEAEDLNSFLKKYDKGELFETEEEPHKAKPINVTPVVKNTSISQTEIILPLEKQNIPAKIYTEDNIQEPKNILKEPYNKTQIQAETTTSPLAKTSTNLDYVEVQLRFKNIQSEIEVLKAQIKTARYTGLIAGLIAMVAIILSILP